MARLQQQLEREWQHLRSLRERYMPAGPPGAVPEAGAAAAARGILKSGQPAARAGAASAAATAPAPMPPAREPASAMREPAAPAPGGADADPHPSPSPAGAAPASAGDGTEGEGALEEQTPRVDRGLAPSRGMKLVAAAAAGAGGGSPAAHHLLLSAARERGCCMPIEPARGSLLPVRRRGTSRGAQLLQLARAGKLQP